MAHLTRVKTKLAIHANRKVAGLLDGQYSSVLSGRSLDFADLREYVPGDDVKDIDWRATARHRKPLVKRYVADRKHTIMLAVTAGRGMAAMANPSERKSDVALMAAGLIGYLATKHGDYVGMYANSGHATQALRPSMREINVERMLVRAEELCDADADEGDVGALIDFILAATRRRNIVVMVLEDVDLTPTEEGLLRRLVIQHEVLLVTVGDLSPADSCVAGRSLRQIETGGAFPDFAQDDQELAQELASADAARRDRRAELCARLGIAHELVTGTDEVVTVMLRLLERTSHRARR